MSSDEAKRLYGIVGLGGVVGGVVGSTFVSVWVDAVTPAAWLWICVAATLGIMISAEVAGRATPVDGRDSDYTSVGGRRSNETASHE